VGCSNDKCKKPEKTKKRKYEDVIAELDLINKSIKNNK